MSDQQPQGPVVDAQSVINQLVQRIGQLEFENAVLRAQSAPPPMSSNGVEPERVIHE